jgi:transcriptional regulator with GAF, ATPase, and Fis domain
MEGTLIHDDERSRQVERLTTELSSECCTKELDDGDALIQTALPRIVEATAADSATLIIHGADDDRRLHRYAAPSGNGDGEATSTADSPTLWDHVPLDREPLVLERIPGDLPSGALTPPVLDYLRATSLQSAVVLPIIIGGERVCVLALESLRYRLWSPALVRQIRLFTEVLAAGIHRVQQTQSLRVAREQLERLTGRDTDEDSPGTFSSVSRRAAHATDHFHDIVGDSLALRAALRQVEEVAATRSTVLLRGETGTGKELFARAIHARSPRRSNAFVVVNCAALPPSLIESELFGHTRGAFTGAVNTRQGRFELAHRGTLFLDEIGDLPLDLQTKLLRMLQEGTFERLGSSQTQKVDVRIIAATHRDLRRMIGEGAFREDLYYRLSVFPIRLPALRERAEDIPKLVWHIIGKHKDLTKHRISRVPDTLMEQLKRRQWPGNVRELENVIEGALIHSTGDTLTLLDEGVEPEERPHEDDTTLSAIERTHIQEVLRACGWRINGAGNAAERLGLHPNTLRFRMKKLGIVREHPTRAHAHIATA